MRGIFSIVIRLRICPDKVEMRESAEEKTFRLEVVQILLIVALAFEIEYNIVGGCNYVITVTPERRSIVRSVVDIVPVGTASRIEIRPDVFFPVTGLHFVDDDEIATIPRSRGKRSIRSCCYLVKTFVCGQGQHVTLGKHRLFRKEILASGQN